MSAYSCSAMYRSSASLMIRDSDSPRRLAMASARAQRGSGTRTARSGVTTSNSRAADLGVPGLRDQGQHRAVVRVALLNVSGKVGREDDLALSGGACVADGVRVLVAGHGFILPGVYTSVKTLRRLLAVELGNLLLYAPALKPVAVTLVRVFDLGFIQVARGVFAAHVDGCLLRTIHGPSVARVYTGVKGGL
jgi:hypothetical protein